MLTLFGAAPALAAAPKDDVATKLDEDAIDNDYLAMKFPDADRKLRQAIAICGRTGCSPGIIAQLHRDLGIVYVVTKRVDDGKSQFAQALQFDASTAIPKELTTPEISAAFTSVAEKNAAAKAPAAPEAPRPRKPPPPPMSEDIHHTPPEEQTLLTAVPLFAEVSEGLSPTRVVVRYKAYGAPDWKTTDMKKLRRGYGVEIPCVEVGGTPGDFKYYIQAIGSDGEVLGAMGSKSSPLRVPINEQIVADPPHLPGRRPPAQCSPSTAGDCPPEFPGCKLNRGGTGRPCKGDGDCPSGTCNANRCVVDEGASGKQKCETDHECRAGYVCKSGWCEGNPKKNWIALAAQQDFLILPAAQDVCLNGTAYACMQSNGTYYEPNRPNVTAEGVDDQVKAGLALATTRFLLAYDRVMTANLSLGGRIGYAFGGGPDSRSGSAFLPVHVEARGSIWFGTDPFLKVGVRPYLVLSLGVAQIDAAVSVNVVELNGQSGPLIAWKRSGVLFGSGGLGIFYALGRNTGFYGEVRGQRMFPNVGTAIPIQIGYAVGI
jgi:hypothetical protein